MTASHSIEAYSFEALFNLKDAAKWLQDALPAAPPRELELTKTALRARLGDGSVFMFDFGALVFVGIDHAIIETVVRDFCARLPREPHAPLREDYKLTIDPAAGAPRVTFDSVVLPRLTPLALECIATVLAQSVTIDYYEEDLQHVLNRVEQMAKEAASKGVFRGSRRQLTKFVASSMVSEVEMIRSLSLLDKPDFTWEDEDAERLYDILRHHLEIQERYRALETKLATVREALSLFLDLGHTKRALFLETTVILLILFEIVMGLIEMAHR